MLRVESPDDSFPQLGSSLRCETGTNDVREILLDVKDSVDVSANITEQRERKTETLLLSRGKWRYTFREVREEGIPTVSAVIDAV